MEMFRLEIINDKKKWNDFIVKGDLGFYSFLSSWEWGEFKNMSWFTIFRYGIYDKKELIGVLPLIKVNAKRWSYLFASHAPLIKKRGCGVCDSENLKGKKTEKKDIDCSEGGECFYFKVLTEILPELKSIAKKEKCNFIRFNSTVKNTKQNSESYRDLGFIDAPMHEHAEDTHLLDLSKSEEDLLDGIKKKDRYYINRARKEWVKIRIDNERDHIDTLIKMHHSHSTKVWYHEFSENYVFDLYKAFGDDISTVSANYNDTVESILMTIKFWKTCVYYIAASSIINNKFSPNYLCQFEAILKAKRDGCDVYNFWGVSPDDNLKHPIAGVTKFKRKFWGYDYSLLHAQDLVVSPKYRFNWIIETIRRKKRGYYYKKPE